MYAKSPVQYLEDGKYSKCYIPYLFCWSESKDDALIDVIAYKI